jgi:predicted nucleic acid-binding protein
VDRVIVLDANVLIAYLDAEDAHHDAAHDLLLAVADDALSMSTLTLAEVLVGPARAGRLAVVRGVVRDLELNEVVLEAGSAERLAVLRAETGLRMPDCCILLAAGDGDTVATFDDRLAATARDRGLTVLGR